VLQSYTTEKQPLLEKKKNRFRLYSFGWLLTFWNENHLSND
jgi:hypothetical protein